MLDSSKLFEIFTVYHRISGPDAAKEFRFRYPPEKLFSDRLLSNNEMVKVLRTQFSGIGLQLNPESEFHNSTRSTIKCDYILFPRDTIKSIREKSVTLINNFFKNPKPQKPESPKITASPPTPPTPHDPENIPESITLQENKKKYAHTNDATAKICLLYTSPSPRDQRGSRMPSSA